MYKFSCFKIHFIVQNIYSRFTAKILAKFIKNFLSNKNVFCVFLTFKFCANAFFDVVSSHYSNVSLNNNLSSWRKKSYAILLQECLGVKACTWFRSLIHLCRMFEKLYLSVLLHKWSLPLSQFLEAITGVKLP